jgi:predicted transcriptional regulator
LLALTEEATELFSLPEIATPHRFSLRRSHLEIRMDILSCIKSGYEKPTQIMYKANLSWTALKEHLVALEDGKFISTTEYGTRKRYTLTDRAVTVLMSYERLLEEVTTPFRKVEVTY